MSDSHRPLVDELSGPVSPRPLAKALDRAASDLAALIEPHAKPEPDTVFRDAANAEALARFVAAVNRLDEFGWSWERIGKYLRCSKQEVMAVYRGRPRVPAYMLDLLDRLPELQALPARMRVDQLRRVG